MHDESYNTLCQIVNVSDMGFTIEPVDKKPERTRKTGRSKYAPIIEAFLESEHKLVRVDNTGKEAYYLRLQLTKVCDKMGLDTVNVSVRNKKVYLEKDV